MRKHFWLEVGRPVGGGASARGRKAGEALREAQEERPAKEGAEMVLMERSCSFFPQNFQLDMPAVCYCLVGWTLFGGDVKDRSSPMSRLA